jgi:putative DNA primase/helicase
MPNQDNQYDCEPWPEPVDGKELVEEIFTAIEKCVYLNSEQILAITYWALHTYFIRPKGERQAFRYSPILHLTSWLFGCGKTVLQDLLAEVSNKSRKAANISISSLYRLLHSKQPVLFLDEIDTYFQNRDELIGILNAGYDERVGTVLRQSPKGNDWSETAEFSVWGAKCLAGIGTQVATLESRAIKIQLVRKPTNHRLERLHDILARDLNFFLNIRQKCVRFAIDNEEALIRQPPFYRDELSDRANDCWSGLFKLAGLIGAGTQNLHDAANKLSSSSGPERSDFEEFLLDLKPFVESCHQSRIPSNALVDYLRGLEDRPYPYKGFSAYDLASRLRPHSIRPVQMRADGNNRNVKGYEKSELQQLISKYLQGSQMDVTVKH